jgi:hypothetical protein
MSYEIYFLTKLCLDNGDSKWVNRYKIPLNTDFPTLYKNYVKLVKRATKVYFGNLNIPASVSVGRSYIKVSIPDPNLYKVFYTSCVRQQLKPQRDTIINKLHDANIYTSLIYNEPTGVTFQIRVQSINFRTRRNDRYTTVSTGVNYLTQSYYETMLLLQSIRVVCKTLVEETI